jgi:outer membrane lipoprotein-sorting protein
MFKYKNKRIYLIIFNYVTIFLISFFSYSCTSSNGTETDNSQSKAVLLTAGELKVKINEQSSKLTSLDCEGDINIDSPELNSSGNLTISVFKPDSIYSKLEGPFGISIADFLITRNNFIYYNIRENTVIKGSSTPLNLGAILRIQINFDDLLNGYACSFYFSDTSSVNSEVIKDKNSYLLKITEQDQTKIYYVNSNSYYIEKYETYDKSGKIKLQIEYNEFESDKNVFSPNNIYITNPSEKQNLWITYNKKIFNKNRLKFKLKIPKSAKVVNWE